MLKKGFISGVGINYAGTLPKVNKSENQLQSIFEAFTNALEAIKIKQLECQDSDIGKITIKLVFNETLYSFDEGGDEFQEIVIEDSGIGFNEKEFGRLIALNDISKGFSNKGSGRIQFLHFFDKVFYDSVYRDGSSKTGFRQLKFSLSKSKAFLDKNAIIRIDETDEIDAQSSYTTLSFKNPLLKKDAKFFNELSVPELKESLITHYLAYFCENRENLPLIELQYLLNGKVVQEEKITSADIPEHDQDKEISIQYSKLSFDGSEIEKIAKKETLNLRSFVISSFKLEKNGLMLTSKGQIAKEICLNSILHKDQIDNQRYLFLLSGDYIDKMDGDTRGELNIPTKEEFKKNFNEPLFQKEVVLLDDIQETANRVIEELYQEIRIKKEQKQQDVDKLQKMFLLNNETLKSIKIGLNDTDEKILEKVYQADAKITAKGDAFLKKQVKAIEELNPASSNYEDELKDQIDELVKAIPLQNRTALTHYVARRKLVLDLFDNILKKQLEIQKTEDRNIDEKLLHNLIFQQSSDNPDDSDLWLINEDFIYFKGNSEYRLNEIEIDGQKLLKTEFTQEEEEYLNSLGENRKIKKPDILLFPDEGKCIIIEFKNPNVNVSVHLNQINRYASLIRNFTNEDFQIVTFYGYLIGEGINAKEVRAFDGDFLDSYHFDYQFRPSKKIPDESGKNDGSLYTEVLKYSTLLKRAILRNKIFIEKLMKPRT